jgi:hypothetical protein
MTLHLARYSPSHSIVADAGWVKNQVDSHVIDKGYNFVMLDGPINRLGVRDINVWSDSWWLNGDPKVFNIPVWRAWEEILQQTKDSGVYVTLFAGMIYQGHEYGFEDFQVFLRYWVARTGAFYNYLGWSPTWEWTDIWGANNIDQIMSFAYQQDPWKRLLAVHDCSNSSFDGWLGFSMRQKPSNSVFAVFPHQRISQGSW